MPSSTLGVMFEGELPVMLRWALIFFVLAIVAGLLGFGGAAGTLAEGAKILFFAFIILVVVFAILGRKPPVA